MLTVGVVTFPPATTVKPLEVTGVRSVLVTTDSVLPPAGPLVRPRSVIRSSSPGLTTPLEKNAQRVTSFVGRGQVPTSVAVVTLWTVPPCQVPTSAPVPAGSVTLIELPASPDSPPVAGHAEPDHVARERAGGRRGRGDAHRGRGDGAAGDDGERVRLHRGRRRSTSTRCANFCAGAAVREPAQRDLQAVAAVDDAAGEERARGRQAGGLRAGADVRGGRDVADGPALPGPRRWWCRTGARR